MITHEIISYIKTEQAKGTSDPVIKSNLIANGWSDKDVSEAIASLSPSPASNVPMPSISNADMKTHWNKIMWTTFSVLLGIDILIILAFKLFAGTYGVFGISIYSILIRILVIFLIASFSAHSASKEDKTSTTVGKSVLKVIGTIFVVILVGAGIFFVGCLFLLSGFGR